MTPLCFLDTNILLYAHDELDARKKSIARYLIWELTRKRAFTVSLQVLNEYYRVAVAKPHGRERRSVYRDNVRRFRSVCTAPLDLGVVEAAWSLQDITDYGWWDLLIIASATKAGCRYLVTEDMQHGQAFGALTLVNPFSADLDEVISKLGIDPPPFPIPDTWP
jgi:predicted nucleic acid-binding protein